MSKFSGKCDLYDHIMMEKMYPDKDNPNILVSDELECFNIFKEKTNGKIFQYKQIKLTDSNIEYWINHENNPELLSRTYVDTIIPDKRYKTGFKTKRIYSYTHMGKTYNSLKELNNAHYFGTIEITFDTILDLVPYYPYIISFCACSNDSETVYISNNSFVEDEFNQRLSYAEPNYTIYNHYKKVLTKHFADLVKRYF